MTLFIWNQRIGQLAGVKDQQKFKYYKDQLENLQADDDFMPDLAFTPEINSKFTNWHFKAMRDIVEFCEKCNIDHVDIKDEAIRLGILRPETKEKGV